MNGNKTFEEFGLRPELNTSLKSIGFEQASPIQEMTIPPILEGKDIFALAETGSGKTGSFAIPLIELILRRRAENTEGPQSTSVDYVVLCPTRELAQQTHKFINQVGEGTDIFACCLIGGEGFDKQKEALLKNPQVVVATPGRLCDMAKQKLVDLSKVSAVVFDEADRLFDMGFKKEVEYALGLIPKSRQLVMVSATTNMDVLSTAYKFHSSPIELKLNEDGGLLVENINHQLAMVSSNEKMPLLVNLLRKKEDSYTLVFCNTQFQTHLVAEWLNKMNIKARAISGRLPQNKRTRLMEEFRSREVTTLICTDVAARGLDVKDINLVINYDMPNEAANYVHRIGRTGRAGKSGEAVSFCAHEDCENLDAITEYIEDQIPRLHLQDEDFAKDLCQKPYIDGKTFQVVERRPQRSERSERPERTDRKMDRNERNHREPAPRRTYNKIDVPKAISLSDSDKLLDRYAFSVTSYDRKEAFKMALKHFRVNDHGLIHTEVANEGRKKFFLFGPKAMTYHFAIRPIYKRILTPFLSKMARKANLDVQFRVSFDNPFIKISVSGKEEGLFKRNRGEMFLAIEQLAKIYLAKKVPVPGDMKFKARWYQAPQTNDDEIIKMAEEMKNKALESKGPVMMRPLNPAERRLVHQHLSTTKELKTKSIGDGRMKRIEISFS